MTAGRRATRLWFEHSLRVPPAGENRAVARRRTAAASGARFPDSDPPRRRTTHPGCCRGCCWYPAAGPSLPAANTTAMPALRSARMSSLNSSTQRASPSAGQRPRCIDDVRRIDRGRVAVGIHQPLECQVNVAHARAAVRVVKLHRDPARVGRDAQRRAAEDDPHRLRAVAERIVGRGFFAVRIEPTVRAAAPFATQVRMRKVDAGVHRRHHHPLAGVAAAPTVPARERRRCSSRA